MTVFLTVLHNLFYYKDTTVRSDEHQPHAAIGRGPKLTFTVAVLNPLPGMATCLTCSEGFGEEW